MLFKKKLDNNDQGFNFYFGFKPKKKKNPHLNLTYNFDLHTSILSGHHLSSALSFYDY